MDKRGRCYNIWKCQQFCRQDSRSFGAWAISIPLTRRLVLRALGAGNAYLRSKKQKIRKKRNYGSATISKEEEKRLKGLGF